MLRYWPKVREGIVMVYHGVLDFEQKISPTKRENLTFKRNAAKALRMERDEKREEKRGTENQRQHEKIAVESNRKKEKDLMDDHSSRARLQPSLITETTMPKGFELFADIKVAGTQYEGRQDILRRIANAGSREQWHFSPLREPQNEYDENAVAIIAVSGSKRFHVGYLPKQIAASVASCRKLAISTRSIDANGSYLYIDLFHTPIRHAGRGHRSTIIGNPTCASCGGICKKKSQASGTGPGCLMLLLGGIIVVAGLFGLVTVIGGLLIPMGILVAIIGLHYAGKMDHFWVCRNCKSKFPRDAGFFEGGFVPLVMVGGVLWLIWWLSNRG